MVIRRGEVVKLTYFYASNICAKREEWTLSLAWSFGGVKRINMIVIYVQSEKSGHCLWHGHSAGRINMIVIYVQSEKSGHCLWHVDIVSGMVIRRVEVVTLVVSVSDLVAPVWWCQRQCPVLRVFVLTYLYDINVCAKRKEWTLSLAWSFGGMYLYDINVCAKREEWTLSLAWSFGGMYLYNINMYLYDINVCAKREEWTLSLAWSFGGMYLYDINVCAKREEWTLSLAWSFGGVKG
ncbi:hypothetical protein PSENEW3_00003466 [Picochlorum sp. SENEW3]|nr:hypothetical protein PSENEW3_00003466 [Picochlorum sp. SENEW3]